MSLKAGKGLKERSREQCKAQTIAGGVCQAPAVERGLCFFHANPRETGRTWPAGREEKPSLEDRRRGSSANSVEEY